MEKGDFTLMDKVVRHKKILFAALSILIFLSGCNLIDSSGDSVGFGQEFSIDIDRYIGLWYEHARTPNSFQDNEPIRNGVRFGPCEQTTAEYSLVDASKVSVKNTCVRFAEDGSLITDIAMGSAAIEPGSDNRKIGVAFGPAIAQVLQRLLVGSNYWIYCIGPDNDSGLYDWAVVSGPDKSFIFVLTRDRSISSDLQSEILGCARSEGLPVDKLIYR